MLPIGQLPDAANAIALVRSYSAAASCLAVSSRWCSLLLGIGAPPGSFFPMLLCGGPATMRRCICIFATALRQFCQGASASNIFPMALCHGGASHKALRHGAPASNKPHSAEKSTPVWLAIWRTWAGFANSQHRDAAFATPDNICAHSSLLQH